MVFKKTLSYYLIGPCLLFAGFSCGQRKELKEKPLVNTLKPGEQVQVVLPENHRDGFTWSLSDNYNKSAILEERSVWHGADKGVYFYMQAGKSGTAEITFVRRNYRDTADIKRFSLSIQEH